MKIILFDFDGVLVDTLSICFSLNAENNEGLSLEEYKSFFKKNVYDAKRFDGSPMKYKDNYFEEYKKNTRELKIPSALKEIIINFSKKYNLVIVSSADGHVIGDILKRENLASHFSHVLGSDFHTDKEVKIKNILEEYKTQPKDAIFITDTVGDILEARKCGVRSIAVSWGFHHKEDLLAEEPFALVDTPKELEQKIEEFFK